VYHFVEALLEFMAAYAAPITSPSTSNHTRYLEIHHKTYRSRVGTNDPSNLTCLCSACHSLLHEKSGFQVKSPSAI